MLQPETHRNLILYLPRSDGSVFADAVFAEPLLTEYCNASLGTPDLPYLARVMPQHLLCPNMPYDLFIMLIIICLTSWKVNSVRGHAFTCFVHYSVPST